MGLIFEKKKVETDKFRIGLKFSRSGITFYLPTKFTRKRFSLYFDSRDNKVNLFLEDEKENGNITHRPGGSSVCFVNFGWCHLDLKEKGQTGEEILHFDATIDSSGVITIHDFKLPKLQPFPLKKKAGRKTKVERQIEKLSLYIDEANRLGKILGVEYSIENGEIQGVLRQKL